MPAAIATRVPIITVPMTVVIAMRPRMVTAPLRRTASRLFHEVHRLTTGVVAPTVFGPVLRMPWRHIHVNRRAVNRYRRPLNDDGLCIDQRRWTTASDLNPTRTHPVPTVHPRWRLRSSAPKPRCPPTPAKALRQQPRACASTNSRSSVHSKVLSSSFVTTSAGLNIAPRCFFVSGCWQPSRK